VYLVYRLGYRLDGFRVQVPMRTRDFSLLQKCPDQLWGPCGLLFKGYESSFLGVK
jgi:hypothetical protein